MTQIKLSKLFYLLSFLIFETTFSFSIPQTAAARQNQPVNYSVVKTNYLNMRVGPGSKYPVIKVLSRGMHLKLTNTSRKGWALVKYLDGTTGWVDPRYIKSSRTNPFHSPESFLGNNEPSPELEKAIRRFVNISKSKGSMFRRDNLSLVVEDLHTGQRVVSINPEFEVKAASLIKVPILQAYMIQRFAGKIRHTKKKQRDLVRMIRFSSNRSTNKIMRLLGGPKKVEALLKKTGMYSHVRIVEYIPKGGKTYRNKISAEDLNNLFRKIWKHEALGANFSKSKNISASKKMLYYLGLPSTRRVRDRLKDGTCFARDRSVRIWDKTGFVRGLNGDVGVIEIRTPKGRRAYSIISIIDRPDYKTIRGSGNAWASRQSKIHRRISEMSYAFFKSKYGSNTRCGQNRLTLYASLGGSSRSTGSL